MGAGTTQWRGRGGDDRFDSGDAGEAAVVLMLIGVALALAAALVAVGVAAGVVARARPGPLLRAIRRRPAPATTPIPIAGTGVTVTAPAGFSLASRFSGLENPRVGAWIMVSTLPAPAEEVIAGFTAEALRSRGMTLRSARDARVAGRPARLLRLRQRTEGTTLQKWMAIVGDGDTTLLVVAACPRWRNPGLRTLMPAMVLSLSWAPETDSDPFVGLPFRLRETEHLTIRNRLQAMLMLAPSAGVEGLAQDPFVVVAASASPAGSDDLDPLARQRLLQTEALAEPMVIRASPLRVNGYPAFELTARGRDRQSGETLGLYQLLLHAGDTLVLAQGMVDISRFRQWLPEFRAIGRSITVVGRPDRPDCDNGRAEDSDG